MSLHSLDIAAVLGVSIVLFSALTEVSWSAQVQSGSTVTLIVHEGQSLRQIAEQYVGDPDLWQEILHASGLESPAQRKLSQWERVVVLARQAQTDAEQALAKTLALREAATQAILSSRSGQVQSQKPLEPQWGSIDTGTTLVEKEKIRTLDIQVPGVSSQQGSSDFWVSHKDNTTKVANYDDKTLEVKAEGKRIMLQRQQGAVVTGDQASGTPKALLATPTLLAPEDGRSVPSQQVLLRWEEVAGVDHYWVEVASDTTFRDQLRHQRRLGAPKERLTYLDEGNRSDRIIVNTP